MIQLSALWKKDSKNGRTYYTGKLGDGRLLLFKNDKKQDEKQPDLILYIVAEEKRNGKEKPSTREDGVPF